MLDEKNGIRPDRQRIVSRSNQLFELASSFCLYMICCLLHFIFNSWYGQPPPSVDGFNVSRSGSGIAELETTLLGRGRCFSSFQGWKSTSKEKKGCPSFANAASSLARTDTL